MTAITQVTIKRLIKNSVPAWLVKLRRNYLSGRREQEYANLSSAQVFTKIYQDGAWGRSTRPDQRFYSGTGSHDVNIVNNYVTSVGKFLSAFASPPDVVDLGCGDFAIGSRLRHLCGRYIACDIVEPVIAWNRERFRDANVDFRLLDISTDALPDGTVAIVRQVLQHLSNEQISGVVARIRNKYAYLVLTEHLPVSDPFVPNIDKPAGWDVRAGSNSGVVLTCPPFNLQVLNQQVLCESQEISGRVRTIAYRLSADGAASNTV